MHKHPQEILDQCVELFKDINHFPPNEFIYPHKMYRPLLEFLNEVRDTFGKPIKITDDYRPPKSSSPSGASNTSWHKKGQAVDIRIKNYTKAELYDLLTSIIMVKEWIPWNKYSIELELVYSTKDKHFHIAIFPTPHKNVLIIKAD